MMGVIRHIGIPNLIIRTVFLLIFFTFMPFLLKYVCNILCQHQLYKFYVIWFAVFNIAVFLLLLFYLRFKPYPLNINPPQSPLLDLFLRIGISLILTGILTTWLIMAVTAFIILSGDAFATFQNVITFLNMYLQISLNFLIGGATLTGASLAPLLQQLTSQQGCCKCCNTQKQSQSTGGGQQSK